MAKTLDKQIWLIDTVRRCQPVTFEEIHLHSCRCGLFGEAGLNERTFRHLRTSIAETFNIEIVCDFRNYFTYHIEDYDKMDNLKSWLMDVLSIDSMLKDHKNLQDRIVLQDTPSKDYYLSTILEAVKENRKLLIRYQHYYSSTPEDICLSPYFVKHYERRWYVAGPSDLYPEEATTFCLDRILDLKLSDEVFDYPSDFHPEDCFANDYGILHDTDYKIENITIKVKHPQDKYIDSLPLHESQTKLPSDDPDFSYYSFRLRPNYEFFKRVLSEGSDFEIVEPSDMRQEVIDYFVDALRVYGLKAVPAVSGAAPFGQ